MAPGKLFEGQPAVDLAIHALSKTDDLFMACPVHFNSRLEALVVSTEVRYRWTCRLLYKLRTAFDFWRGGRVRTSIHRIFARQRVASGQRSWSVRVVARVPYFLERIGALWHLVSTAVQLVDDVVDSSGRPVQGVRIVFGSISFCFEKVFVAPACAVPCDGGVLARAWPARQHKDL